MTKHDSDDGDVFDSLLNLENDFYQEGFKLGEADGQRAGHLEGRAFGIEKGFEKFVEMGKLNGRANIWSGRLAHDKTPSSHILSTQSPYIDGNDPPFLAPLSSKKLESHLRTLYALTEPDSLSTTNDEEKVADFDDRLRRAQGKIKIIEKVAGDADFRSLSPDSMGLGQAKPWNAQENIEDVSILQARH